MEITYYQPNDLLLLCNEINEEDANLSCTYGETLSLVSSPPISQSYLPQQYPFMQQPPPLSSPPLQQQQQQQFPQQSFLNSLLPFQPLGGSISFGNATINISNFTLNGGIPQQQPQQEQPIPSQQQSDSFYNPQQCQQFHKCTKNQNVLSVDICNEVNDVKEIKKDVYETKLLVDNLIDENNNNEESKIFTTNTIFS